jgi:hypothetical protein
MTVAVAGAAGHIALAGTAVSRTSPESVVDALISDMVNNDWDRAYDRFGPSCVDFDASALRRGFAPALRTYREHEVVPPHSAEISTDKMLLVRGFVTLDEGDHPLRAELGALPHVDRQWDVCGLRIDAP